MILNALQMIMYDNNEDYIINIPSLITLFEREQQYNSLFYFQNRPLFLLEFCCQNDFLNILFNHDVTSYEISMLYSHLFNLTNPLTINTAYKTNRCHWIAKCFQLKDHKLHLLQITENEKVQQDLFGFTPLHYAFQSQQFHLLSYFSHPKVWLKNNKGQSIELLYSYIQMNGQSIPTISQHIQNHYLTQIEKIARRYQLSPLLISLVSSKLSIDSKNYNK